MKLKSYLKSKMNKRGQVFEQMSGLAVGVLSLAIVLVVVFLVLAEIGTNDQVVADANATAATNTLTDAAADIPDWVALVVLAVIGALLLSIVQLFRGRGR